MRQNDSRPRFIGSRHERTLVASALSEPGLWEERARCGFSNQTYHRLPDPVRNVLRKPTKLRNLSGVADASGVLRIHADRPNELQLFQCRGIEGGSDASEALERAEL